MIERGFAIVGVVLLVLLADKIARVLWHDLNAPDIDTRDTGAF